MLNSYSLKSTFAVILSFMLLSGHRANGQNQPVVRVQSPNVAHFDKFSSVPVNLFTGTPDISIPLHTMTYGSIQVPIGLRYHPASVKAASHPGWVGEGWDLLAGGCIRRTVRGGWDEAYNSNQTGFISYYPAPGTAVSACGAEKLNVSDWNSSAKLVSYFTAQNSGGTAADVQADEFSFNFLGHSGKFYYAGSQGWKVVSDENVKIELNSADDFLDLAAVNGEIQKYTGKVESNFNNTFQSRAFSSFILTSDDGTKYFFGGKNAIEFNSSFVMDNTGPAFLASAWYLTKIVDPQLNEINFSYKRDYPACEIYHAAQNFNYNCGVPGSSPIYTLNGQTSVGQTGVVPSTYSGYFYWPLFLDKISSLNETVTFSSSVATCLRLDNSDYTDLGSSATAQYMLSIIAGNLNNIQWEKLDGITISNTSGRGFRQFSLTYNNLATQRLALLSLQQKDNLGNMIGQFQFSYNDIASLPRYDGNYSDHWGFFNGSLATNNIVGVDVANVFSARGTNASYVTKGLLTKLTYPTGGYTQFTWEPHDYSQYVGTDRASLIAVSGAPLAGGSRISDISSYQADGTLADEKKYVYRRGYSGGADPNSLTSSGVLNQLPQYVFDLSQRLTTQGNTQYTIHEDYVNPYVIYSYNGQGSYIGYDEVVELNRDGSYSRNYFSSYGSDFNNVSHFDQVSAGSIGWLSTDNNVPHTDLEVERGKPVAKFEYTPTNIIVRKTINTYRSDVSRFDSYIKHAENSQTYYYVTCNNSALILGTANKIFTYAYYPTSTAVTTYDPQGNNPVTTTTSYTYNINNLVSTKSYTNSKNESGTGQSVIETTVYPTESSDGFASGMVGAHMLKQVVSKSINRNGSLQQFNKTIYSNPNSSYPNMYLPQFLQQQNGTGPLETRQEFDQYDANGNVLEMAKSNDINEVYLWSYNAQYPVAKIVGSTYAAVNALLTQSQIDHASESDPELRTLFANLRNQMPGVFITSYSYSPVFGMTSMTDPQGRTTYYDYDGFGRMVAVRDMDNNVIKRYCYNYAGQTTSCALYYNSAYSQSASKSCPAGFQGTSVTYTVPAQTYAAGAQADADNLAHNDAATNAQNYANANGACQQLYYNDQQQGTYTTTCPAGQTGTSVTYVVAAGTYSSTIDKNTANQLAMNDVAANGQAYANGHGQCNCNSTTVTLNNPANANGYRAIVQQGGSILFQQNFPAAGTTATFTVNFPPGTYTIGFAPTGGPGQNHSYTYSMGPNFGTTSGTSGTFQNINVAAQPCTLNMTIN